MAAALFGGAGFYAYRTYDYIEHDNDFCMSCHLMAEPYERFGESAHRGLGCKACHQPTLLGRSQMALTQLMENPDSLSIHAEVPNERCADCHIRGDPEKWRLVANSVGHKIHMESDDPVLGGLQCVECHSTSVHEFAPTDRTCAQSQCHTDTEIRLGAMGGLMIHCAACHNFVAPTTTTTAEAGGTGAGREILPAQDQCLGCHAMRLLVEMPDPDPHGGDCALCHNPHDQVTPAEAVGSCATSSCHGAPDTLTAFHRGLPRGTLDDCVLCHAAHDFAVPGGECQACHTGIERDDPRARRRGAPSTDSAHATLPSAHAPVATALPLLPGPGVGWWRHTPAQEAPDSFLHSTHRVVSCGDCHATETRHGAVTVTTRRDCQSCHHRQPLARDCARCHVDGAPASRYTAPRMVAFSVGTPGLREMAFDHGAHPTVSCEQCHTEGVELSAQAVDCAGCHQDHHRPQVECVGCHQPAPKEAHPVGEAHLTCSGSGCHAPSPFPVAPRTRELCLGCHQELDDHHPERSCAECHTLPPPRRDGESR